MNIMNRKIGLPAMILGAALAGCSTPRLAPDAQGVSFPVREASYRSEGVVVSRETVQLLQPGLSKEQVRQLVGNPHFSEGLIGVREWDYILRFPAGEGGLLDCQLQIRFDEGSKAQGTHWQTESCAAAAGKTALAATTPTGTAAGAVESRDAGGDTWTEEGLIFPFGRSRVEDLRAEDRARLKALVARTTQRSASVQRIVVSGYADRIGSGQRKQWRSLDRAHAVAAAFVAQGIAPSLVEVVGRSDAEPQAACQPQQPVKALVDCLAPDRRVSVTVQLKDG